MCSADGPYCVPMCFAYQNGRIYLHSAVEGRKISILQQNPKVCILVERGCTLVRACTPCGYGMTYESVMITGEAHFLSGTEKRRGIEIIASKYAGYPGGPYPADQIANIAVIEVLITSWTGRRSGTACFQGD